MKLLYIFFVVCLAYMGFLGAKAYTQAKNYEIYTTELVAHQGVQEQAKRQFSKFAKHILGDYYNDEKKAEIDKIRALQHDAMKKAQRYTYYFVGILSMVLCAYFVMSLQAFTIFGAMAAMISLFYGLIAPILMVTIHKKVEYLGDIVLSFESKGIVGSIEKLWESGDMVVAMVILIFSVLIPIVKISSLLFVSIFIESTFAHGLVKFFKAIGKWSMVDVFVVAVFLVYLTANKGDVSRAEIEVGLYFFLSYVIVSMLVSLSADKLLHKRNRIPTQ